MRIYVAASHRKAFLLLCVVVCFSSLGWTQTLTIKDQETSQPLDFATIASNNPRAFVTTNAKGQVDIQPFQGAKVMEIRLVGYETVRISYDSLKAQDFRLRMNSSQISLDQVVISASRWNQSTMEVPTKVTSINPRDIALQNPQTAADLLGISGEVYIQKSQQGGGSPMIRGFSTNRLLYTIDGVRMNTAIFRSGNLQNVISLDPFAMESAEVLFGPGSILYGSDAIGGVMSFQTLTPQFATGENPLVSGKATMRYASANQEKTGHMDINLGWKKWASVTSISHNNFGDLRMGKNGPNEYLRAFYVNRRDGMDEVVSNPNPRIQVPTGYSQTNLMQKLHFRPNETWSLQYGFHYSATTDFPRYDRLIQTLNNEPMYAQWKYGPQIWMMNHLAITHRAEDRFYDEGSLRLAQQYFEESRISRGFNEVIRSTNTERVDAYSLNLDFNKQLSSGTKLFYGLDLVFNDVESTGLETQIETGARLDGPSRYPSATWSSYAGYLTLKQPLNSKMTLQIGARYNAFILKADFRNNLPFYPFESTQSTLINSGVTGSLGWIYHPRQTWSLTANLSTGFRAPNVDDVGKVFDSEPGAVVVPNTQLDAEYAYNAEAGIAKVFGEWLKIDFTTYYTLLDDAMVRRDFTLNDQDSIVYEGVLSRVQAIQNAAISQVYGVQFGLEAKLPGGFAITSQFNYQKGREELDDGTTSPSRHAAPWFGITRLSYQLKGLNMQVYAIYNGERRFEDMPMEEIGKPHLYASNTNGNPYAPGWYTLNLKAAYQLKKHFYFSAGVENLTDERYRPYSSGLVAPGRNFILSATVKF